MTLKHKIVYETISNQFNLVYYKGQGGYEPMNYTYFHDPDTPHEPTLQIEVIPKNKTNPFQTVYIMLIKKLPTEVEHHILDTIQKLYTDQTLGQPCNYIISFNTSRPSVFF